MFASVFCERAVSVTNFDTEKIKTASVSFIHKYRYTNGGDTLDSGEDTALNLIIHSGLCAVLPIVKTVALPSVKQYVS